jgi:KaiC/GvpD/RAD55 family RecA-like ATPase
MLESTIDQSLVNVMNKNKHGIVIMTELPTENYFDISASCIKRMVDEGYQGIYISFQRPFANLQSSLIRRGVDVSKLLFIDVASSLAMESQDTNSKVVHISQNIDINELIHVIYTSLPSINNKSKFIYIDSLSTITLHKPLSETLRFSEFLIRTTKKTPLDESIFLIFNVSKDLTQRKFIKDIALRVNEVVR